MDFFATSECRLLVGVAVALVAVGVAYVVLTPKKRKDILLKDELDSLSQNYPDRFKVYYVLNQPPEVWNGGIGFVTTETIQAHCPPPASDIQILRCGPPPMNKAMATHLNALGYSSDMQFQF